MAASGASSWGNWAPFNGAIKSVVATVREHVSVLPVPELPKDLTPYTTKVTDLIKIILKQKLSDAKNVPKELFDYATQLIKSDFPVKHLALVCNCVAEKIFELNNTNSDDYRISFVWDLCKKAVSYRRDHHVQRDAALKQAYLLALDVESPGAAVDLITAFSRAGLESSLNAKIYINYFFEQIQTPEKFIPEHFYELLFKVLSGSGAAFGEDISGGLLEELVKKIVEKLNDQQICAAWASALVRMIMRNVGFSERRWPEIFRNGKILQSLQKILFFDVTKNLDVKQEARSKKREEEAARERGVDDRQKAKESSYETNSFMDYLARFYKAEMLMRKKELTDKTLVIRFFQILKFDCTGVHGEKNKEALETWFCKTFDITSAAINER